jgi:hypothetical protein
VFDLTGGGESAGLRVQLLTLRRSQLRDDGHFNQAEAAYRRALHIIEKTAGLEHAVAAALFHNLGGLEHARGRFADGEGYVRRSVEIRGAADVAGLAALWMVRAGTTKRRGCTGGRWTSSRAPTGQSITKWLST